MVEKFLSFEICITRCNSKEQITVAAVTTLDAAKNILKTLVNEYIQAIIGADSKLGLIGKAAYSITVDDEHVLVVRTSTLKTIEFSINTKVVSQQISKNELRLWAEKEVNNID